MLDRSKCCFSITKFCFISDVNKIYTSHDLDPDFTPKSLQNKVQWDLQFYFALRGTENMYTMKKDYFKLCYDKVQDLRYVELAVDKETKNLKETNSDIESGLMPEMKDNKYCPVTSYLIFLLSLSRQTDLMWQTPKYKKFPEKPTDRIWYGPERESKHNLEEFVTNICKNQGYEDQKYTNRCLRVTGINTLKRLGFSNRQAMAVGGHKSESSLLIYQKVSKEEKLQMAMSLGHAILNVPKAMPICQLNLKIDLEKPIRKRPLKHHHSSNPFKVHRLLHLINFSFISQIQTCLLLMMSLKPLSWKYLTRILYQF